MVPYDSEYVGTNVYIKLEVYYSNYLQSSTAKEYCEYY